MQPNDEHGRRNTPDLECQCPPARQHCHALRPIRRSDAFHHANISCSVYKDNVGTLGESPSRIRKTCGADDDCFRAVVEPRTRICLLHGIVAYAAGILLALDAEALRSQSRDHVNALIAAGLR